MIKHAQINDKTCTHKSLINFQVIQKRLILPYLTFIICLFINIMKKRGRSTDQALLRTTANKKLQTFSHKRLMKDLEEIEKEKIPTVGVVARPLDGNLFTWHANIRGPEGTLYEGGVFHLELVFPQSYPHHPPTITLFNPIPHPNVFGEYICLDMIQQKANARGEEGQGWSSAYSVQSVLTQLQSFLFEENLSQNKEILEMSVKKAIKEANVYKCRACKHGGKLSCWPVFSNKENSKEEYIIVENEKSIIQKELVCYHTKLPFSENQLGLGLKVSKVPRTGNIREAETFYDYISIKAFLKESVHHSSNNERMTHWIPVYFGKGDNKDRFLKFLTKAISMIMTNSTRNFSKEFVLEVLPKLMVTIVYHIMDEKKHASIRFIRLLTHIHSIFLFCLNTYPELKETITVQLKKFIADENARTKEQQTNLGCVLALLTGIDSHCFKDVAEFYFMEQLDRQVLWILKAVPELLDETMEEEADVNRAKIVFKSQMTSFQMFCFYRLFISEICEKRKSRTAMLEEYEDNLCKLSNKEEEEFQQKIFHIQKKITSFQAFFEYIGLPPREENQITDMLKTAIKNSARKKYHGEFETLHELPQSQEQFKKILEKIPNFNKFITVTENEQKKEENSKKANVTYTIKESPSTDEDWKKMCLSRWSWIKEALGYEKTLTSRDISEKAIDYSKEGIMKAEDRLMKIIKERYRNQGIDYKKPKIELPEISWKQLFLRLDLEDFLLYINMNPDFNSFYEKLEVCKHAEVNTLLIPIVEVNQIKSGYYYLTALLTKMTKLKYIEFSGLPQKNQINDKSSKAIKKGFHNFIEGGGRLSILSFHNLTAYKDYSDSLFEYLTNCEHLKSLRFDKTNILIYGNSMKVVSNSLINIKDIEQLEFNECQLNEQKCKNLADVLMRSKKLRIFRIHNSSTLANGLGQIIYNLSFSPNLELIDISRTVSNVTETVISLYKMLKISASIEVLLASNVNGLNQQLVKEFWTSLGECKSLRVLDLGYSGDLSSKKTEIGNSIAFNASKKGVLEYMNLTNAISGNTTINDIYKGMCISEYDEEKIYGDPNKAQKMIASNYTPEYYNNLKALQFSRSNNINPGFNLAHFNKLIKKEDPNLVKLLARSKNLTNVSLEATGLNKNFAQILSLALDPSREEFVSKIKVLDLSKNNLGKDGIKALAEVLPKNNILEVLDLSKNFIGVSGANELSQALRTNKSLKFLNVFNNKIGYDGAKAISENIIARHPNLQCIEMGHNRIRDKGVMSLTNSILENQSCKLKILGLRFNFITNNGATYMYNKLSSGKTSIEEIFIKNNQIDDMALNNLERIKEFEKCKISIDMLEKLKYLDVERMERSVWIHPIQNINLNSLKRFFEITHEAGIVIDARVRRGKKYPNKQGDNIFGIVEFADTVSVNRALHLASKKMTFVDGIKFRVYKVGTGTFVFSKKTSKQKKLEQAKSCLPPVPYDAVERGPARMGGCRGRGRGRGVGGRGRGRGRR